MAAPPSPRDSHLIAADGSDSHSRAIAPAADIAVAGVAALDAAAAADAVVADVADSTALAADSPGDSAPNARAAPARSTAQPLPRSFPAL